MKTKQLLAASVAVCLGATSALGQVSKTPLIKGGDDCANAQNIPTSAIGVNPTTGEVTSIIASNEDAGPNVFTGADDCWAAAADDDVWFEFTTPGSTSDTSLYTISSDNGVGVFDTDVQLALYDDNCSGTLTRIACNDDAGDCNALAAGFTVDLVGGTKYYLQADIFGAGNLGKFALTIFKNEQPVNSCISNAYDIEGAYDALSSKNFEGEGWFVYNPYTYDTTNSWAPDRTIVDGQDDASGACNSDQVLDANSIRIYFDTWFEFDYTSSDPASLISVYSKNDCIAYGIELFEGTPQLDPDCENIDGLTRIGCSIPDGFPESGNGNGDRAVGNFLNHPRVLFDPADQQASSGKIYARVYQYTRVLVGDTSGNTVAPPSEGLFKISFEAASTNDDNACSANASTKLNDGCDDPGTNFTGTFTNISNAGANGGLSAAEGSTANLTGTPDEPTEFVVANGTTRADFNCDGDTVLTGAKVLFNNNSIYCRFSVADTLSTFNPSDFSEILRVTVPIDDDLDPLNVLPQEVQVILDLCDGVTVNPGGIQIPPGGTGVCSQPITTVCGADVSFKFSNLEYCGPNGSVAEFYVVPANDNCTGASRGSVAAAFGELPDNSCDGCLEMGPGSFYLPTGDYYLVVDGDAGSLVNFDLELNIEYFIPGTIIPCGLANCNASGTKRNLVEELQTKKLSEIGFVPTAIAPNPAKDFVNISYNAGVDGQVYYTVTNMTGQVVSEGGFGVTEGEGMQQISTSDLAPGMYAFTMILDGVRTQFKLMKD